MSSVESKPLFRDLNADDPDPEVTRVESMCMNCHANGETRLLLTRIPYYKNVVLMSFSCEECGFENNEIQPGGAFADKGVRFTLKVVTEKDLNRQIVKSDHASIKIPEVDLEIPAKSQKGEVTTVEGILLRAITGLSQEQAARRVEHPEAARQIDDYIDKLINLKSMKHGGFTLILEDISGNAYIENPQVPQRDPNCSRVDFKRTPQQDHELGIFTQDELTDAPTKQETNPQPPGETSSLLYPCDPGTHDLAAIAGDEVLSFSTNCPECNAVCDTRMKLTNIPHFKEVVIMATVCDACGHKTNEVKSGGGIEERGVKFEVRVASRDDFNRDILTSETCEISIPELELEVGGRALGGRFTTAEGLLHALRDQLDTMPSVRGDAASATSQHAVTRFLGKLDEILAGKSEVTLILDDPAGNSYVQSLNDDDPTLPDDGLKVTRYERTFDQNEYLGLNDIKTEGYDTQN